MRVRETKWQDLQHAELMEKFPPFKSLVVKPKSPNQAAYLDCIRSHVLTFCNSPAGAGKTLLPVSVFADLFAKGEFKHLIAVRPIVECGPSMGFLPGTEGEKLAPYMKPILSKLAKFFSPEQLSAMRINGTVEIATLNTMRGDEFEDAFVILDEAQNCTEEQMRMFCTRIGANCKVVVNGDLEQSDLSFHNGLERAIARLKPSRLIGFVEMTQDDVVRSEVVRAFLASY